MFVQEICSTEVDTVAQRELIGCDKSDESRDQEGTFLTITKTCFLEHLDGAHHCRTRGFIIVKKIPAEEQEVGVIFVCLLEHLPRLHISELYRPLRGQNSYTSAWHRSMGNKPPRLRESCRPSALRGSLCARGDYPCLRRSAARRHQAVQALYFWQQGLALEKSVVFHQRKLLLACRFRPRRRRLAS